MKDCSIHDSMTRWITLHATQGVLLARNVGYMSIGHGYYIEDGTETDNKLYSNIGILARAGVDNRAASAQDARHPVAGDPTAGTTSPYHSDTDNPTVFWIMNGWNDFRYNFAAGAGGCGACYWLSRGPTAGRRTRTSATTRPGGRPSTSAPHGLLPPYAAGLRTLGRAGMTPLQNFVGNTCVSAMNSFQTVGDSARASA